MNTVNKFKIKYNKIGELLFETIDSILNSSKNQQEDKKNNSHYLSRLAEKCSPSFSPFWNLIDKIKNHPDINKCASDVLIRVELSPYLSIHDNMIAVRKKSASEIGHKIITRLSSLISPVLVIFPLEGFLPVMRRSSLGNCKFGTYKEILDIFNIPEYEKSKFGDSEYLQNLFNQIAEEEKDHLNTICIGTNVLACDRFAAFQLARNEINHTLNFIRLLLPLNYDLLKRPKIGINGVMEFPKAFIISIVSGKRLIPISDDRFNITGIFTLNKGNYRTNRSLEMADRMLRRSASERSNLENRILSALSWVGEGIDAFEKDVKVVKCVVGLETLFRIKGPKQNGFKRGVANIFQLNVKDTESMEKKAEKFYRLRSSIVHQGKREIEDNDAILAEFIASGCMLQAFELIGDISSVEEFDECLNVNI